MFEYVNRGAYMCEVGETGVELYDLDLEAKEEDKETQ